MPRIAWSNLGRHPWQSVAPVPSATAPASPKAPTVGALPPASLAVVPIATLSPSMAVVKSGRSVGRTIFRIAPGVPETPILAVARIGLLVP